jgi:tetratricopeptide (TPR) repeat protein
MHNRLLVYALNFSAIVARSQGEYEQAERFLTESLQINRREPYTLRELGYLAVARGDYHQAKAQLRESLAINQDSGFRTASVFPLDGLGTVARLRGEYQQAEQLHQESLAICREIDELRGIALCLNNLGLLAYDLKEYPKAEQLLQESLTRYEQIGHRQGMASALCHLGYVACALGNARYEAARQQFHQSLEIAMKIGARPVALNALVGWATWLSASVSDDSAQERAVELLALVTHHPASEQETKDKAGRLLAELASSLPSESVTAAQERGKAGKLDTVLLEMLETAA